MLGTSKKIRMENPSFIIGILVEPYPYRYTVPFKLVPVLTVLPVRTASTVPSLYIYGVVYTYIYDACVRQGHSNWGTFIFRSKTCQVTSRVEGLLTTH